MPILRSLTQALYGLPILLLFLTWGCQNDPAPIDVPDMTDTTQTGPDTTTKTYTYLALGDSYTIGESVPEPERWPNQLADSLQARGIQVLPPTIVARTGWTTDELASAIESASLNTRYDLVSLLIGVNNQFRNYTFSQYEAEFVELLNTAMTYAGGNADRVFVVSIPDYGVTPFGARYNPEKIAQELDQYNAFADSVAQSRGIAFYNITPISREAKDDPELIAPDQLHPSGKMYTRWVSLFADQVADFF